MAGFPRSSSQFLHAMGNRRPHSVYTSAMQEMSKATKRRYQDPFYHLWAFAGHGLDIGGGDDPLGRWCHAFARMKSCRTWDKGDGDAQELKGVKDNSYDWLASSHCLEHLHNPYTGLRNWIRVVKPGGWLTVTIPDATMYEQGKWPSRWNGDHKWMFSMSLPRSADPPRYNVLELVGSQIADVASPERIQLVRDFYSPALAHTDQTLLPNVESAIEFVLRKHG